MYTICIRVLEFKIWRKFLQITNTSICTSLKKFIDLRNLTIFTSFVVICGGGFPKFVVLEGPKKMKKDDLAERKFFF